MQFLMNLSLYLIIITQEMEVQSQFINVIGKHIITLFWRPFLILI